ncbi:MAG: HU family DNA-binding protein, partial [Bacteroidales bacterium]|nr:HU family DNA-binding protein [Bacteroidales bacterium]
MKEGKFMIQDLADVLSQRKNISAEKARDVARMFFDTILAGLEKDRFVKIKGLGTFKLVSVDNRESVDVNSGERIVIEGHSKVSFTPDNALKEAVNRPFAHFETVVLNDEVTDEQLEQVDKRFAAEQEQANEVVSKVIPEVIPEEKPIEEPIEESIEKPVETVIETPAETPAETVTETLIETAEAPVEKPEEAPKAAAEEPVIPVVVQQETQMDGQKVLLVKLVDTVQVDVNKNATNLMENNEINNNNKSGKSRTALWIVCVVMALLLGYILGYFRVFGSSVNKPTVVKDTVYIEKKQERKANADTLAAVQEVPAAEVKAQEPAKPQPVVEAKPVEKKPV